MSRLRSSFGVASVARFKFNSFHVIRLLSNNRGKSSHYEVLEVTQGSSQSEIKEAYYKLSKQFHPDRNPGDDDASDKFRKITEAYDVLSNTDTKRDYDRSLAMKDTTSSPYTPKYGPSAPFREINRTTGRPIDSDDYTQFYKNRQAQLGRSHNQTSDFKPPEAKTFEEVLDPFKTFIDPHPPPIKTRPYKYYSESGWQDPSQGTNDGWEIKGDVSTPVALLVVFLILSLVFTASVAETPAKYSMAPKPKSDPVN